MLMLTFYDGIATPTTVKVEDDSEASTGTKLICTHVICHTTSATINASATKLPASCNTNKCDVCILLQKSVKVCAKEFLQRILVVPLEVARNDKANASASRWQAGQLIMYATLNVARKRTVLVKSCV